MRLLLFLGMARAQLPNGVEPMVLIGSRSAAHDREEAAALQPQPPAELLNPARGPRESEVRALQHEAQGLHAESAAMATEAHELAGGEAVETTLIGDVTPGESDVASPASPAVPALSPASPVPALDAAPGSSTGAAAAAVQQAQAREAEVAGLEARMRQIERAANQQASGTGGPAPQMAPLAQAVPQSAQPGDIPRKVVANQYTHVSGSSGLATAVLAEQVNAALQCTRACSKLLLARELSPHAYPAALTGGGAAAAGRRARHDGAGRKRLDCTDAAARHRHRAVAQAAGAARRRGGDRLLAGRPALGSSDRPGVMIVVYERAVGAFADSIAEPSRPSPGADPAGGLSDVRCVGRRARRSSSVDRSTRTHNVLYSV